jgi:hypothetical protein
VIRGRREVASRARREWFPRQRLTGGKNRWPKDGFLGSPWVLPGSILDASWPAKPHENKANSTVFTNEKKIQAEWKNKTTQETGTLINTN